MSSDASIPLDMPPIAGLGLSVDLKKSLLLHDNQPLTPVGPQKYEIIDAEGQPAQIMLTKAFAGRPPRLFVNGVKHDLLPPFTFYQSLWIYLPVIAAFPLGAFYMRPGIMTGIIMVAAFFASSLNAGIFRAGRGVIALHLIPLLTTLAVVICGLTLPVVYYIATGKINLAATMEKADSAARKIILEDLAEKINNSPKAMEPLKGLTPEKVTVENGTTLVFPAKGDGETKDFDGIEKTFTDKIVSQWCFSEKVTIYREYKAIFIYRFINLNDKVIKEFKVDTAACPASDPTKAQSNESGSKGSE